MLLSRNEIRMARKNGTIVIDPFREAQLNTASYDVTLGKWVARYNQNLGGLAVNVCEDPAKMYQIYEYPDGFELKPGERVLAHTNEIVGGRQRGGFACTTALQATSTAARIGLSVCQCAGWGDIGFVNRWTLELQNHSPRKLRLPVGMVLGQIVFYDVEPVSGKTYDQEGRYQHEGDLWVPEMMLPKPAKVVPQDDRVIGSPDQ